MPAEKRIPPEAEVSRAIDEVLAAEKQLASAVQTAAHDADTIRREATVAAQRVLERANRRIGAIHRKVAADIHRQVTELQAASVASADEAPGIDLDSAQLDRLAERAAEWLTTDADD